LSLLTEPLPRVADATLATLFNAYRALPGHWDEMVDGDGSVRPHWRRLVAALSALSPVEMEARWQRVERILYENGLTHNIHAEGAAAERPWRLDAMPLLLDGEEWQGLARGLAQRARLLDALLDDCYGDQRHLLEGRLPSPLILASPQFLRPCHGIRPVRGRRLHYYAADVGRGPDGRWKVLRDRCELGVGGGYALENRIALRNCLPDEFNANRVQQLAGFFQAVNHGLFTVAQRPDPRVVVLAGDPSSPDYFAHSYLSRYQGFVLVEGADLTVRDNRVYLKTVEGLRQVDVIVRRIVGSECDPLELRATSAQGVPGLMEAVRAGGVLIVNSLGSGLVDTEGLMPYLPRLCREILGDELELPSIPSWWCGEAADREHVLANLEGLETRNLFSSRTSESSRESGSGTTWQVGGSREFIEHRGYAWLAREPLQLATAPVLRETGLEPVPYALRVFLAAVDDDYVVMPGGLARLCPLEPGVAFDFRRSGDGKDAWVLPDGQMSRFTPRRPTADSIKLRRTGRELPSRTADNLFWLARYAERAEGVMRQARASLIRLADEDRPLEDLVAMERVLLPVFARAGIIPPSREELAAGPHAYLDRQLDELVFDPERPYGLRQTLSDLTRTVVLARDRLSADSWHILRGLTAEDFQRRFTTSPSLSRIDAATTISRLQADIQRLSAFSGMGMENMTRALGWRFLDMGRRIERSIQTVAMLETLAGAEAPEDDGSLLLVLEIADSFMTYRSRYLSTPQLAPVLDLLLVDETNPRSVAFQLADLASHGEQLPRDASADRPGVEWAITMGALDALRRADVVALSRKDRGGDRPALRALLDRVAVGLPQLSDGLTRAYFSHADAKQLAAARIGPAD
jgi:uncharacterized circularly permuted ATP-grasp superfamily protein/uncharacterized alpha-E superfamily protein